MHKGTRAMNPQELNRINEHIFQYDVTGYSYLAWVLVFVYILAAPKSGMKVFLVMSILGFAMLSYSGFASAHATRYSHPLLVVTSQRWGTVAKILGAFWVVIEAPKLRYLFQVWAKVVAEMEAQFGKQDGVHVSVIVRLRRMTGLFGREA